MKSALDGADFPATTKEDWLAAAGKALTGDAFDVLVSRADDGFDYGPVYERARHAMPIPRAGAGSGWRIVQRIDDPEAARANVQALADLAGGADALSLVFEGAPAAHGFGLPLRPEAIETALAGVELSMIHLRIEPHMDARIAVDALRRLCDTRGEDFCALDLDLCLDGMGPFARSGAFPGEEARFRAHAGRATRALVESGFKGRTSEADGRVYHDAGATEAQELGAVLATAVYYLRAMDKASMDVAAAAAAIGFTLALDQREFFAVAKLRALRLLWRRTLELSGIADTAPARIHAETSWRMMAAKDPHTNILRTTVAAFAAGVGGADSLSVLPHTTALGLPDAAARRLARNLQLILLEESGLARVADPASGSGGIEALTEALCEAGWSEFQKIESEGGIFRSLSAGAVQSRIVEACIARQTRINEKREPVVGVTLYPMDRERDNSVLMKRDAAGEIGRPAGPVHCQPLEPHRLSGKAEVRS